nr:PREDICTED: uncharacterized protein LOC105672325 isoform X2 [Linepithema humile]
MMRRQTILFVGSIDLEELIRAFKDLGIEIAQEEATKLLQRMDQDGSLKISYDEWRDFLLYAPSTNLLDIIEYWHHTTIASKVHTVKCVTATDFDHRHHADICLDDACTFSDVREARAEMRGKRKNRLADMRSPFWWGDICLRISLVLAFLVSLAIGLRAFVARLFSLQRKTAQDRLIGTRHAFLRSRWLLSSY